MVGLKARGRLVEQIANVLVPGRAGRALDGSKAGLEIPWRAAYGHAPFTVELRVRVRRSGTFLAAFETNTTEHNWKLTAAGGDAPVLHARMSGFAWGHNYVVGTSPIADDHWHDLAFTFDGRRMQVGVDGREETHKPGPPELTRNAYAMLTRKEPLLIGTPVDPGWQDTCDALIEEVRVSDIVRPIGALPTGAFEADSHTVGLWRMELAMADGRVPDLSPLGNDALIRVLPPLALDDLDRERFHAGPSPLETPMETVALRPGAAGHPAGPAMLVLDGEWQLAANGNEVERLTGNWPDAIPATVPGGVHMALERAGIIPDPKFGRNDQLAHDQSFQTWWYCTTFARPRAADGARLVFDGVANHATVWLNGRRLGEHEGMFGGPTFEVAGLLEERNTLVVKVDPAPGRREDWNNPHWQKTVTFNNTYGWHYSSIPALGIWRSVRVAGAPAVRLKAPFVATHDAARGEVSLVVDLAGAAGGWTGTLHGSIAPENFAGAPLHFVREVRAASPAMRLHLRFRIPEPRPWWPNGLGDPNLYRLTLSFVPPKGVPDRFECAFGLRTIAMAPLPEGPQPKKYNWTFVVNGCPMFVKGSGWCTMDSSMDFSRARYARFLSLARDQHCQMLRGWGSGMPETDDFYDLCDRYGIMVMQEWPTAWDSHERQPYEPLVETVQLNTLRLRNHPSLVMWGAGNETPMPIGRVIDRMARAAVELDGSRPFHRSEPWGGSAHNYDVYWGDAPLERMLSLTADFWGEFGIAALPVYESVQRYLPDAEKNLWPPPEDGAFAHHTPTFNKGSDLNHLRICAGYFTAGRTMRDFIRGSQVAQATGVRHTLELARTRWPHCTGALYYKANDNYPAASWSFADWYGAPKIAHYVFQDAFAPLLGCALFPTFDAAGQDLALPVFLLDDADALQHAVAWNVIVRAYDSSLNELKRQVFAGQGQVDRVRQVGTFNLPAAQTATHPLLVVVETFCDGQSVIRTCYWINFATVKDCLFTLPRTTLALRVLNDRATVTNTGRLPAVGVHVERPGHLDTFRIEDNYFWLDPGEARTVVVSHATGLESHAWNCPRLM
jgi:beta-mannosidase